MTDDGVISKANVPSQPTKQSQGWTVVGLVWVTCLSNPSLCPGMGHSGWMELSFRPTWKGVGATGQTQQWLSQCLRRLEPRENLEP